MLLTALDLQRRVVVVVLLVMAPLTSVIAQTLQIDGQSVTYESSPDIGSQFATFQIETTTARDVYLLDCEVKQFLWTQNFERATGERTERTADAQWRAMNNKSRVANAVYAAICPQLLAAHQLPTKSPAPMMAPLPSDTTATNTAAEPAVNSVVAEPPAPTIDIMPPLAADESITPDSSPPAVIAPLPDTNENAHATTTETGTYAGLLKIQPEQSLLISLNKATGVFHLLVFKTQSALGERILSVCQDLSQCQFTGTIRQLNIVPPSEFSLAITSAAEIITVNDVTLVML